MKLDLLQAYAAIQRGRGLGSLFSSLFRFLKPVMASGLNLLKDEDVKTGANILSDLASGGNPKEIFQDQRKAAIKNLRANVANQLHSMYGSGKKRKAMKRPAKSKTKSIAKRRTKTPNNVWSCFIAVISLSQPEMPAFKL